MSPSSEIHSVSDILERLEELAAQGPRVNGGALVRAFGSRSYGPLLMLPPMLEISPLGGVPGFASTMAVVVALVAGQMMFGLECCWLPRVLTRGSVPSAKIRRASEKMRPLARRLDRWFHGRLRKLTRGTAVRAAAMACILLACTVPLLEFVPFASTAPMAAIALFGLALLVHDGALMVAAFVAAAAAIVFMAIVLA